MKVEPFRKIINFLTCRAVGVLLTVAILAAASTGFSQTAQLIVHSGHAHSTQAAAFSPDGKLLVTGDAQRGVKVWDAASGLLLKSFDQNKLHAEDDEFWPLKYVFAFSDDRRLLAVSYGQEDEFLVWSLTDGRLVSTLDVVPDGQGVTAARFVDDGQHLAVIGSNLEFPEKRSLTTYDVASGKPLASAPASKYLNVFNPRERITARVSKDLKRVDLQTIFSAAPVFSADIGVEVRRIVTDGMSEFTDTAGIVSGNAGRVAVNYDDDKVRVFDIASKRVIAAIPTGKAGIVSCDINKTGDKLLCLLRDRSIVSWHETDGPHFSTIRKPSKTANAVPASDDAESTLAVDDTFIKIGPDDRIFAVASPDRTPALIDLDVPSKTISRSSSSGAITQFMLAGDEQTMVFGFRGGVSIWKISGERRWMSKTELFGAGAETELYLDDTVTLSPNGQYFSTQRGDSRVLWRTDGPGQTQIFSGSYEMGFSGDSKYLICRSTKVEKVRRVFMWDIEAAREVWSRNIDPKDTSYDGKVRFDAGGRLIFGTIEADTRDGSIKGKVPTAEPDLFKVGNIYYDGRSPKGTLRYTDGGTVCVSSFTNVLTKTSFVVPVCDIHITADETAIIGRTDHGEIKILNIGGNEIMTLIPLGETDRVIVSPDGRFDTNMDLSRARDLYWITPDAPLTPRPLELFMRQYYEPGMLNRLLECNKRGDCDKQFKRLPRITEINRAQPRIESPRTSSIPK